MSSIDIAVVGGAVVGGAASHELNGVAMASVSR